MDQRVLALRNQRYLQEMGITLYTPRHHLPGAGPSRRMHLLTDAKPATEQPAPPLMPAEPREKVVPSTQSAKPAPVSASQPPRQVGEAFSLAVVIGGGWMWLDQTEPATISQDYLQLFKSILYALNLNQEGFQAHQFSWPMHNNHQLDLGPEAARDALSGFVGRLLAASPCDGVVLMGETAVSRVNTEQLGLKQVVKTVSAWQMMQQPELKKTAWKDLQGLRRPD